MAHPRWHRGYEINYEVVCMKGLTMALIVVSLLLGGTIGFYLGRATKEIQPVNQVLEQVEKDNPPTKEDIVTTTPPDKRVTFDESTRWEEDTVPVPEELSTSVVDRVQLDTTLSFRLVSERPLNIHTPVFGRQQINLTYWNPNLRRWQQDIFDVPEPRFKYGIEVDASLGFDPVTMHPSYPQITTKGYIGYRSIHIYGGYTITRDYHAPVVGLRLRFGR